MKSLSFIAKSLSASLIIGLLTPSFVIAEGKAPQGLPAEVIKVVPETLESNLEAIGSLKASNAVVLTPEVAGRIKSVDFADGAVIESGQLLFKLDASVQKAQLAEAQARVELSQVEFKRANKLFKQRAASETDRDSAKATLKISQAQAAFARAQLDKLSIQAPFAGMIGIHDISVGDYINPGQALVELVDISTLKFDFSLPEIYLSKVKVGQHISIQAPAFPGQTFTGSVLAIAPKIEEKGRSLLIRAVIDNKEQQLRPGLFAKVLLEVSKNDLALLVPEQALIPQGKGYFVMTVVDGKVAQVPVVIGQRKNARVEITSGIKADDVVIIAGQIKLRPGSPVTALFPEMLKAMGQ